MLLDLGAVQVFVDGLMRRRLAGEDEIAAGFLDGGRDRLAGEQIVPEIDRPKVGDRRALPGQPALGGVAFAILLLRPILRGDEFRRQRQDLLVAGGDHAGADEGVEIFRAAIRTPPRRALLAFDLARAVVLGSVQRDQHPPVQTPKRRQWPGGLDCLEEQPVERRRRGTVQHRTDVVVGGNRRHGEQRLAVRPAVPFLQRSLVRQERWASHEEDRERRQTNVGHCVVAVTPWPLALVGKTGADLAQLPDQLFNGAHQAEESVIEPKHQGKPLHAAGFG